ncbi:MAG: hypothetical protein COW30_05265 [Rhodospirillales bacterium CG15_BIG_FIL_POST_REV_8_21_14_020_66_15]|nr:MAG: hypothetical protein COW30_05265 [Rhodospirillales bacterium CG15_BIG_FIL_POST_REV_8_21_14_020_66_15]
MTTPNDPGVVAADAVSAAFDPGRYERIDSRGASPGVGALIPAYLRDVYEWAYLNPANARILDTSLVVSAILLGNNRRLQRALLAEISPGQRVLQAAHVYGDLIPRMAAHIGPQGWLDVIDVVRLQAAHCRRKLEGFANARVRIADAGGYAGGLYDVVSCFFLLHELPDDRKRAVVDNLLAQVGPGGRAVFVDYHRPAAWHPLRGAFRYMFKLLEPFAESVWHHDVSDYASVSRGFSWEKRTFFGGLYQCTVADRR